MVKELPSVYQSIIHKSRYSRFLYKEGRRESWEETVDRLVMFLMSKIPDDKPELAGELVGVREAILNLEVMPSMRLMMSAGEAVERDNIAAYNCSYLAVNNKRSFSEALYILMNGTGVGFSCERQEITKLPPIPETFKEVEDVIVVGDSKLGWAKAFKKLLSSLWEGDIPKIDYSRVRGAGERLKTFGGRASGPEPLKRLFDFCIATFKTAAGRKLNSLEVHDIMCMIGEIVVVGGVRRSALISLSNLHDSKLQKAKSSHKVISYQNLGREEDGKTLYSVTYQTLGGLEKSGTFWLNEYDIKGLQHHEIGWYHVAPHRGLANNSVAYTEQPDSETFMEEWLSLVKSKSGERGIFNRAAAQYQAGKWGRRDTTLSYGTNPCSEIILRDKQFCNLTEVVVREGDTFDTLATKVRIATILGTIQSTLTDFHFLSEEWKKNTEEERLLGVSLTGIMDNKILSGKEQCEWTLEAMLEELRNIARDTNEEFAERLGIPASVAITCVKPSGTVSQLVDSASGIHSRHSTYYIRRIRMDKKDPIYNYLKDKGIEVEDEAFRPDSTAVFSFPMKAPEGAVTRNDMSAIEQLELWLIYQRHWCEHKPSVTISVKDDEWVEVGAWVWKHFDEISGVSFLPYSNHTYVQAPYEDITKEQYDELLAKQPIDFTWEGFVELGDNTEGSQTLACVGGICEI
jgi:ribonucleoside-triphosphate reductase